MGSVSPCQHPDILTYLSLRHTSKLSIQVRLKISQVSRLPSVRLDYLGNVRDGLSVLTL